MNEAVRTPTIPESLISARLLMLQSRRLILATLERRLRQQPVGSLRVRVDHMRDATASAHANYCSSMLRWGSSDTPEYWPVAFTCLITTANSLTGKLRGVAPDLPLSDRYLVATDVEVLEQLVEQWRDSARSSIAAVA